MEYGFLSRAGKFLQEQAKSRRGTMVFLCLAAGVTLGTLGFLKLYGQAMTHKVKMLDCQYEVHEHTEDCYEENEDGEKVLICGLADYVIHVHNDDCYDQKGELVCQLEEHELHEHDESCWEEEEILICEEEESEGSAADGEEAGTIEDAEQTAEPAEDSQAPEAEEEESGSNAETVKELACEKEEHKHDDSCYADGAGCEKEAHTHGDSCYEKTEELVCDASEHTHDDSCYTTGESELTCEESEHTHDDGCYDEEGNEVCGESEHTHDDGCYSEGESELTCGTEEHTHGDGCYEVTETLVCETEEHEHDDSCAAESELVCGIEEHEHDDSCYVEVEAETEEKEESESAEETGSAEEAKPEETVKEEDTQEKNNEEAEEGHTHTDDCYETREVLTCGELELHTHDADPESETCCYSEDCFDEEGSLIEGSRPSCGLLQLEEHIHTEECFKTVELTPEEIAAINGGATLHVHTDECYDEEGNLICGHEVTHLHQLECYDEDGNLICGFGGGSHVHEESCYDEEGNLICGYETAVHPHTPDCYDEEGNLICGYETAVHVHMAECYDEEGNLICGYEAEAHEHDIRCYDEGGNLICGYEDAKDHEHDGNCYDEEGNLICGYEGVKDHEHDAGCYDIRGNLVCGYEGVEDHVHTEACYDEGGNLICGYEVLEVYDSRKIYENDKYIVVVKYNNDANIPEEAELIAEEITPDSDQEHYGNRETEYREMLKDETASMRALLKIGFYLEGEEIEPETPVAVSIQFIDEDGLAEGKPITVIHFAEGGTEKLDGSDAKDNSTSFKMMSFSEIAIGYGSEEEDNMGPTTIKVRVSKTYEYEDPMFQATFHVEGDVVMPDGLLGPEDGGIQEENMFSQESQDELSDNSEVESDEEIRSDEEVAPEDNTISEEEETDGIEGTEEADDKTEENMLNDTSVLTEEQLPGMIEFIVEPLREDADEYKAAEVVYGDGSEEVFLNRVLSYYLTYADTKLDLSDCKVTMEVQPTQTLVDYAEENMAEETEDGEKLRDEMTLSIIDFVKDDDEEKDSVKDVNTFDDTDGSGDGFTEDSGSANVTETEEINSESDDAGSTYDISRQEESADNPEEETAADSDETQITEVLITGEILDAIPVTGSAASQSMLVTLNATGTENRVAAIGTSQANPTFTVEFYAEIDVLADAGDDKTIRVIDTAKRDSDGELLSDGSGGNLPTNGGNMPKRNIKVKEDGTVVTETELTEVYASGSYDYISAPGLVYFNKIAKNDNYELKEIHVQRKGSVEWETYNCEEGKEWHFTNKTQTKEEAPDNFILITEGAKIRLVHTVREDTVKNGVSFYDYDVSDGNLYSSTDKTPVSRGNAKTHNSGATWYMYTNRQGINSNLKNQTFGFGNGEGTMKTGLGDKEGNWANSKNAAYGSPTFGLVTGLKDGKLQYKSGVIAPNLFNEGTATGKSSYAGDLIFSQKGDTYTLTGAEVKENGSVVSSIYGVDKFTRQRDNWNETYYFAGNDFYPLDGVSSAGTIGHDLMFGAPDTKVLKNFSSAKDTLNAPASDDGENHNHYFGMHYTVEFDLVEDYVGPLEYLFYGDDDMWVFLDGPGYTGKLICDIGGVHSSVGEYVNLWDYIKKGSEGKYKLTFFYTERGASGSTCWMQFTLPSVSFATTEQDTGELRIEKKVTGTGTINEDEEFGFEIKFKDSNGSDLMDDYSYTKFDSENNVISNDILIWNNAKFTLKAGEYIIVKFLPHGSTYTISEVGPVIVKPKEPGEELEWDKDANNPYTPEISGGTSSGSGVVTGSITKDSRVEIEYNNVLRFALPETGGPGTDVYAAAGALLILLGAGFVYKKKFRERRV